MCDIVIISQFLASSQTVVQLWYLYVAMLLYHFVSAGLYFIQQFIADELTIAHATQLDE